MDLSIEKQTVRRLTTHFGEVKDPQFSPCGQWIAFSANRDGSREAYVMPSCGGQARKLSFTGAMVKVVGWRNADTVILSSAHNSPFREGALYEVARQGGPLQKIAVGSANAISFGPSKNTMVIQRHGYGYPSWKRYRGGTCGELWLKPSEKAPFTLFCKQNANMLQPVWHQGRIYFLSDFQGHGNVYSADLHGQDIRRHTHCEGFYVRSFCIDQDQLVYAQQGQLFTTTLNLNTDIATTAQHLPIHTGSALHHTTRKYDFSSKTRYCPKCQC